jgi:parallel beta-helix repeat protein
MRAGSALIALVIASSPALAKTISIAPSANDQEMLQTALIEAAPGDVVELAAGRYTLASGLSLDVDNVTVRGAGPDKTVLSFKGQTTAGEGLLVTSDRVLLTGFAVEDTKGDGIKAKGVEKISFDNLRVEWTRGPNKDNGAYGIYPVESKHVLVQNSTVIACADAGVYVGQSDNIVVRGNRVSFNVAGIEIENSTNADVYSNLAMHNTGGILIFDLPNLPKMGGNSTRVFSNSVVDNDTPNFAAPGNIVAEVPRGLGIMVMANDRVEVTGNRIEGNRSGGVMIVSYLRSFDDKSYNPLPRNVRVFGNAFGKNGWAPAYPGGAEIAAAFGGALPPVMWDGVTRFADNPDDPATTPRLDVPAVSLGLGVAGTPTTAAKPAPFLPNGPVEGTLAAVVLPADQPMP